MKKYHLIVFISVAILGVLTQKFALACDVSVPPGYQQPKLEGLITYREPTGLAYANEFDYYGIMLEKPSSCGANTIYIHKNFAYAVVPIAAILLGISIATFLRKTPQTPKP